MSLRQPVPVVPAADLGRVHFIGVGGVSMSGIARLLAARGLTVTGCDRDDSAVLVPVREAGVAVAIGHDPAHLDGIDTVVFNSALTPANAAEIQAVADLGLRSLHRSAALASLMAGKRAIGVSGTHGKTSTSGALVAAMSSTDPSYAVGSTLATTGSGAADCTGEWFLIEADESDGSFLQYDLEIAIVTNIEADHLDNWETPQRYADGFLAFATQPGLRVLVCSGDDAGTRRLVARLAEAETSPEVVTYGESPSCTAVLSMLDEGSGPGRGASAQVAYDGRTFELRLSVPGRHSLHNALAAYLAARAAGLAHEAALAGVESFRGTARRFELVGEVNGIRVVDDYSHHPTEVRAGLASARAFAGDGRVIVVFQPHLFTRTRDFAHDFGEALALADEILLVDIYPAREEPIPGVTSQLVVDAALAAGGQARLVASLSDAAAQAVAAAAPGDVIVAMGAGSVTKVARMAADLVRGRA